MTAKAPTDKLLSPIASSTDRALQPCRQSALVAIGRRAVASSDVSLLLHDAAALLVETLNADGSCVAQLDPIAGTLSVRTAEAADNEQPPLARSVPLGAGESLPGYALSVAHPVSVADLDEETRFRDPLLKKQGVRSAIVCPLKLQELAFGTLGIYRRQPHAFDDADMLFLETISHLITTTIARERSERALSDERSFASTLLETVPSLVMVLTPAGRITRLNRTTERLTGFRTSEVRDRPVFSALLVPEEVVLMEQALERLRRGESPQNFEGSILTRQGGRRRVAWNLAVQTERDGRLRSVIATGADITEQCAVYAELTALQQVATQAQENNEKLSAKLDEVTRHATTKESRGGTRKGDPTLRPFQRLVEGNGAERRGKPRRSYPYVQLIAPLAGDRLPGPRAFQEIQCHDISASGFSFFASKPPAHEKLVVAFGAGTALTYVVAQVVHCTRVDKQNVFAIGCRYTGRAAY